MSNSLPRTFNGTAVPFFTRSFPSSRRVRRYGLSCEPERLLVLGRSARRERIGFRRRPRLRTRLLAGFVERPIGRISDGIDGGIGLHDERPEDRNVSRTQRAMAIPEVASGSRVTQTACHSRGADFEPTSTQVSAAITIKLVRRTAMGEARY